MPVSPLSSVIALDIVRFFLCNVTVEPPKSTHTELTSQVKETFFSHRLSGTSVPNTSPVHGYNVESDFLWIRTLISWLFTNISRKWVYDISGQTTTLTLIVL